jgi:hypothetical protein
MVLILKTETYSVFGGTMNEESVAKRSRVGGDELMLAERLYLVAIALCFLMIAVASQILTAR